MGRSGVDLTLGKTLGDVVEGLALAAEDLSTRLVVKALELAVEDGELDGELSEGVDDL